MEYFIVDETISSSSRDEWASSALLLRDQDTPTWWPNAGELKGV